MTKRQRRSWRRLLRRPATAGLLAMTKRVQVCNDNEVVRNDPTSSRQTGFRGVGKEGSLEKKRGGLESGS